MHAPVSLNTEHLPTKTEEASADALNTGTESPTPKQSKGLFQTESGKGSNAYVSVDLDKYANHKLPDLEEIDDLLKYTTERPIQELVVDVILIGAQAKKFRDWFYEHAEFVHELRDRLPSRGRNAIEVIRGGTPTLYKWSDFCLTFFGVSADWVRKLLSFYQGMAEDPEMQVPERQLKKRTTTEVKATEAENEFENETPKPALAIADEDSAYKLEATKLHLEIKGLLEQIEKFGEKLPVALTQYARQLRERLALMDKPGNKMSIEDDVDELDEAVASAQRSMKKPCTPKMQNSSEKDALAEPKINKRVVLS
jgi:hypothetical protein